VRRLAVSDDPGQSQASATDDSEVTEDKCRESDVLRTVCKKAECSDGAARS